MISNQYLIYKKAYLLMRVIGKDLSKVIILPHYSPGVASRGYYAVNMQSRAIKRQRVTCHREGAK